MRRRSTVWRLAGAPHYTDQFRLWWGDDVDHHFLLNFLRARGFLTSLRVVIAVVGAGMAVALLALGKSAALAGALLAGGYLVFALLSLGALLSAFMNNVGAMALLMVTLVRDHGLQYLLAATLHAQPSPRVCAKEKATSAASPMVSSAL